MGPVSNFLVATSNNHFWLTKANEEWHAKELGFRKCKNPGRFWNEGSKHWQFLLEASMSIKIQTARREYLKGPVQIWVHISKNKGGIFPEQNLPYKLHDTTTKKDYIYHHYGFNDFPLYISFLGLPWQKAKVGYLKHQFFFFSLSKFWKLNVWS